MVVRYRKRPGGRSSSQLTDIGAGLAEILGPNQWEGSSSFLGNQYGEPIVAAHVQDPVFTLDYPNRIQNMIDDRRERLQQAEDERRGPSTGAMVNHPQLSDVAEGYTPFDDTVNDAWNKWMEQLADDPADYEAQASYARDMRALDEKEADLRQAILDNDIDAVNDLIAEIAMMKEQMRSGFRDYRRLVDPVLEGAVENNEQLYERNAPAFQKIAADAQTGVADAYRQHGQATDDLAALIGAGDAAAQTAAGIVGELEGTYSEAVAGRLKDNLNLLQALEDSGVAGAKATMVMDRWRKAREGDLYDKKYDDMTEAAKKRREELRFAEEQLALDRERNKKVYEETMRRLSDAKETPNIDSISFGQMAAFTYLSDKLDGYGFPADRQLYVQAILEEAWDNAMFEEDQFHGWMMEVVEDSNGNQAPRWQLLGLSSQELSALLGASGAYVSGRDQFEHLQASHVASGSRGDTSSVSAWKHSTSNGRIAGDQLVLVPPPPGVGGNAVRLAPMAVTAWQEMVAAARAEGIRIQAGGSYRTYEAQVQLAKPPSEGGKGLYGVMYGNVKGLAARPGTSNHGWGLAVDIIMNQAAVNWLRRNAGRFGFRTIADEPWHWEYRGR